MYVKSSENVIKTADDSEDSGMKHDVKSVEHAIKTSDDIEDSEAKTVQLLPANVVWVCVY